MTCDISRAFFHVPAGPPTFVEIPEEDKDWSEKELVGKLKLVLYGTREAAAAWQKEAAKHLIEIGCHRETFSPCLFHHRERKLMLMVHGDDYAAAGPRSQVNWLSKALEKRFGQEYVKTELLSIHDNDKHEISIFKRMIRLTEAGIEMEADVRHAEIIIR